MNIKFTKMHGLGNDFMVIDAINQHIDMTKTQIAALAKRDTGVGFDQLLMVERSAFPQFDFFYRIFNADGQEVGQCGNGARCLALFVKRYGLTDKNEIQVYTKTSELVLTINTDHLVSVLMGKPKQEPKEIPFLAQDQADLYPITLPNNKSYKIHALQVGNPHAVLVVDNIEDAPVEDIGCLISTHPLFPEQTNVGFMQILANNHLRLRVYERGCGETQACGSGAVAAAAVGRLFYNLDEKIKVSLPGGDLWIHWPSLDQGLVLTGPASFVYEGRLEF